MDSKVRSATWALDRGVSVVICNGTQDKAIKTIIEGRKVGTFFTESAGSTNSVEQMAENGNILKIIKYNIDFPLFQYIPFSIKPELEADLCRISTQQTERRPFVIWLIWWSANKILFSKQIESI